MSTERWSDGAVVRWCTVEQQGRNGRAGRRARCSGALHACTGCLHWMLASCWAWRWRPAPWKRCNPSIHGVEQGRGQIIAPAIAAWREAGQDCTAKARRGCMQDDCLFSGRRGSMSPKQPCPMPSRRRHDPVPLCTLRCEMCKPSTPSADTLESGRGAPCSSEHRSSESCQLPYRSPTANDFGPRPGCIPHHWATGPAPTIVSLVRAESVGPTLPVC